MVCPGSPLGGHRYQARPHRKHELFEIVLYVVSPSRAPAPKPKAQDALKVGMAAKRVLEFTLPHASDSLCMVEKAAGKSSSRASFVPSWCPLWRCCVEHQRHSEKQRAGWTVKLVEIPDQTEHSRGYSEIKPPITKDFPSIQDLTCRITPQKGAFTANVTPIDAGCDVGTLCCS